MTYKEKWELILEEPINNMEEFIRGQHDCKYKRKFEQNRCESYKLGYKSQEDKNSGK